MCRSHPIRHFVFWIAFAGLLSSFTTPEFAQTSNISSDTPNVTSPAQETAPVTPASTSSALTKSTKKETKKKKKLLPRGEIAAAPIPISSPAIGSGLIPVVGYIFPLSLKDKKSPPSVIGAAGLITNNSSRGLALIGQLFMKEDRYELTAGYVHGNLDYNIYGGGILSGKKLGLEQTGDGYMVEFLRRIAWKFLAGPRFMDGHSFITVQQDQFPNFLSPRIPDFTPTWSQSGPMSNGIQLRTVFIRSPGQSSVSLRTSLPSPSAASIPSSPTRPNSTNTVV